MISERRARSTSAAEALFFAAVTLSFLAAKSQRWWLAGLAGMFAGATRLNGLFLLPALFARWWHSPRRPADLLMLAPIGFGLVAFSLYLWGITGNGLAFKDIQVTWGRQLTMPWVALLDYLDKPLRVAVPMRIFSRRLGFRASSGRDVHGMMVKVDRRCPRSARLALPLRPCNRWGQDRKPRL